jgi:ribosomal protein L37E
MKWLRKIIKFYMPGICPKCGEKTYDRDEGTCTSCGLGYERD